MNIFRRRRRSAVSQSLEEIEADPEYQDAQAAANAAPPPPPSQNPYWDVIVGPKPQFVEIPDDKGPEDS